MRVYGHPFASFYWKLLIALYEREVPFEFLMVDPDHPENGGAIGRLTPTGQFPVLIDGDRTVIESAAIIEYLDLHHGDAPPMVPADPRAAIEARQLDGIFDDYVSAPLTRMVLNALRDHDKRDPYIDAEAKVPWTRAMRGRTVGCRGANGRRTTCSASPTAPRRRRSSMPIGGIRSRRL